MKAIILTALALIVSATAFAQTDQQAAQHRRVIKHKTVIEHDSVYYAPDTIAVVFQELIVKPDTVYTKWNKGYVIWQTYVPYYWQIGSNNLAFYNGTISANQTIKGDKEYFVNEYKGNSLNEYPFLYADRKTKVTNKVIFSIKQ